MSKIIPKYDNYELIGRTRMDAAIALANSDATLRSRGLVEGAETINKFGSALAVGTSLTPIASAKTYKTPVTATALEILSDSTDDNGSTSPLGTGALTVRVYGLKTWTGETTEDVTLNGTAAVALTGTWLRIYRVKVLTSGTYATDAVPSHSSTITIRESGGGATWAEVESQSGFGLGQSEIAAYSVPTGKVAFVCAPTVFVESNKAANILFYVREGADDTTPPCDAMQTKIILRNVVNNIPIGMNGPLGPFTGPCDIGWMGAATATTANIEIHFEIYLFDA